MSARGGDRLTPIIARIRDFLLQRKYNNSLRYADAYSKRTLPPAFLPYGVNHNLSANDYFRRDLRREAHPPKEVYACGLKQLTSGTSTTPAPMIPKVGEFTPGEKWDWDRHILD